ncbi:MAG TPA: amidohydrolase family protein [Gaiellaceae bacterium]
MTVVDAHAHVFAAVSDRFPRDVHELFPAEAEATAEELLAEMARAGVDLAVLVPLTHHDEYLRDCLERFPGKFAGIGVQRPGSVDVDEYRRRREQSRLQGLRLFALGEAGELAALPLLAELARLGDKLWFYGGREQMQLLERALDRLPELTVVLNHLGFWPTAFHADEHGRPHFDTTYTAEGLEAVTALARFPRVYVLCTGMYAFAAGPCPYDDLRPVTAALLRAYGPGRLLAGSDFPWIRAEPGYAETIGAVDAHFAGLPEAERARIRGGNALELFTF